MAKLIDIFADLKCFEEGDVLTKKGAEVLNLALSSDLIKRFGAMKKYEIPDHLLESYARGLAKASPHIVPKAQAS